MWYTGVVVLGAFLLWSASSAFYAALLWLLPVPPYVLALPHHVLRRLYVPEGFIVLLEYVPHALFVACYYLFFNLCESKWFRFAGIWDRVRREYFEYRVYDERYHGQDVTHSLRWRPPHLSNTLSATGAGNGVPQQCVYAVVPHGIYAEGSTFYFVLNGLYDGVVVFATSLLFWLPLCREFASLVGAQPATSECIGAALDAGQSILILPEGMRGALHVGDPLEVLRKRRRLGFVKQALASKNASTLVIVPVYIAGVERLYDTWLPWPWLQHKLLDRFYYPWPILNFGWYGTFWPKRAPLSVRFGVPIRVGGGRTVENVYEDYVSAIEGLMAASPVGGTK